MKKKVNGHYKNLPRPNEKLFKEYKVPFKSQLLEFLLTTFTSKSRNNIKKLLSNHQVLVNGAPITQFDFELIRAFTNIDVK